MPTLVARVAMCLGLLGVTAADPCPTLTEGLQSHDEPGEMVDFEWISAVAFDATISWVDFDGNEQIGMTLTAGTTDSGKTRPGHAYRVRTFDDELVQEVVIPSEPPFHVIVEHCDDLTATDELVSPERALEFEQLVHDPKAPCEGPSKYWSCIKKYTHEEYIEMQERLKGQRGFLEGETTPDRVGEVTDTTYHHQIPRIPKTGSFGNGYVKMSMPKSLKDFLLPWFAATKHEADPHEPVGWVMNEDKVNMTRLNLDKYPDVRSRIVKEIQQVIQWWTQMRVKHTSTYGVRIYTRDAMLINHVDRVETHISSVILQVDQDVDEDGGWPVEVLLPNRSVAEVYLQAGEMLLYESGWLRHGRPNRFRGNEFANIFSHFAPVDWDGVSEEPVDPNEPLPHRYHGYFPGRCDTVADIGEDGCTVTDIMDSVSNEIVAAQREEEGLSSPVGPAAGEL